MRDAFDRHLCENGAICIPSGARVYAQLVEGHESISTFTKITQPKSNLIRLSTSGKDSQCVSSSARAPKRLHLHADKLIDLDDVRLLSDPLEVLSFNFSKKCIPSTKGGKSLVQFNISNAGEVHGVLYWWELDLFEGITYSTKSSAMNQNWQDHWRQSLYVLDEKDYSQVNAQEIFDLNIFHDDYSISFSPNRVHNVVRSHNDELSLVSQFSAERLKQLNDQKRFSFLEKSIAEALKNYDRNVSVLDLSDFCMCGLIAAKLGARVTSIGK